MHAYLTQGKKTDHLSWKENNLEKSTAVKTTENSIENYLQFLTDGC